MNAYDKAVYGDVIAAIAGEMARAARLALKDQCAGAPDETTKAIFAEATVMLLRELDEAQITRAVRRALEPQP